MLKPFQIFRNPSVFSVSYFQLFQNPESLIDVPKPLNNLKDKFQITTLHLFSSANPRKRTLLQEPLTSKKNMIKNRLLFFFCWVLRRGGILIKKICELVTEEATVTSI